VYVINDFNNVNNISIKKYYFFELFKDFYTFDIDYLNLNLLEKIRGFIFYENNYYLLFENQLILFDDDNFKLVKVKEIELGENLVKLKVIENLNILAVFEDKIIIKNIFENSLVNEIKLVFNRKLLFNQEADIENKEQFKIKEKLTFEEINDFLEQNNDNLISFFNLISIQKYDNFYLFFFDIPFLFAVYEANKLYFYPILFSDDYNNLKNNYDKLKIISNISNLIFFKFEEQYYFAEFELIFENYPKIIIKDVKLLNIKEENVLKRPISFIDNKVFFLYQNNLYFLNLKHDLDKDEIKNEKNGLKLIGNSENIISNINYFDDGLFYSFFVNENQVVLKIYELASNTIKNEIVFENVADKYRNLLIDSVILNFKSSNDNKFYLQIFKNNYIYNLELIINDSFQNFKLLNYFELSLENISKILKIDDIIFIYCDKGLYYFEPNLNYLNLIDSFEITKKLNLESELELNLFNNLIISGKIEELSKWEKILITNGKILDIIFYQDKVILVFENYIAVYNLNNLNNLLNLKSKDFMEFLEFDNIIYLNRYFENKILKEDKLFLLDDIGNFSIVNIKTGEIFKTYLGYLNEGKLVLIDNNIYVLTKEGYYIKVDVVIKIE
jgi:hypothetical protein